LKALALGYHDVFEGELPDDGGLRPHAALYALERSCFRLHVRSIPIGAGTSVEAIDRFRSWGKQVPVFLTFDDGAIGAYSCIADELEQCNCRGHFFIVTNWIGRAGFMDRAQIRELRRRGHVIGTHSCSHPERMANLAREEMQREWVESCTMLADILGEKTAVASVPNGYYSRAVGETAAAAGIEVLFNSEPTMATHVVSGCLVLGRYAIKAADAPLATAELITRAAPRWNQALRWKVAKTAKLLGGPVFLALRTRLLARRAPAPANHGSDGVS
jgi:peptidoglycan/xylan/chitin deacetylase (PgdA/CDA1 family)